MIEYHRPSSLPMLAKCPQFRSGGASEFAEEGTERHRTLVNLISHSTPDELNDKASHDLDEAEALIWARDYIQLHAPTSDYRLEIEKQLTWLGPMFEERRGTPDYVCGPHIFDFKWRHRDYSAQMADYALAVFDSEPRFESIKCHLLFGATKQVIVLTFTKSEAESVVSRILSEVGNPDSVPRINEYCGWCSKRATCPAFVNQVNRMVEGREDWKLSTLHASDLDNADDMGLALRIARTLAKWCEAVEHFAKEMVEKRGIVPTGFEIKPTSGRRYITDAAQAFTLLGLPQDEFLRCCDVRMNTSKEYPDKVGVNNIYAKVNGLKVSPAKREVEAKLDSVIKRGRDGIKLVAIGEQMTEQSD